MINKRFLTGIGLACLLAGCSGPIDDRAAAAAKAFAAQDYFTARDLAQDALRENADNPDALAVLARAQIAMGQGGNALATLQRLQDLGKTPTDFALLQAESQLQTGNFQAVTDGLDGVDSAEAWRLRALVASAQGDEAKALSSFEHGRISVGDKTRLYVAEASWHLSRSDAQAARAPVALAQEAAPDRVETLFVTARLAQLEEKPELATRAFLAILEKSPLDRPALLGAIAEMGNLGRIDLLRPLVARGFEAYPNDPEFVFLAARVKAQDGDWEGVRNLLQTRESTLAGHPDSRGLYGEALLELGQVELARSHLAPLYREQAANAQVVRTYTRILLATGEAAKARDVIAPLAAMPDALPEDIELAARAAAG